MTNETNQDPQQPTKDQPPPKQYATPQPGQPGKRGTDERASKTPGRVESSEGDDDDQLSADKGAGYDEDGLVKGTTGNRGGDQRPKSPGQSGGSPGTTKPGTGTGQSQGSGSRQSPGSGGSGSSSGSGNATGRSGNK